MTEQTLPPKTHPAFAVLCNVVSEPNGATAQAIAAEMGLTVSTIHRHLGRLEQSGGVKRLTGWGNQHIFHATTKGRDHATVISKGEQA